MALPVRAVVPVLVIVDTPEGEPATPASLYPGMPRNVDSVAILLESSDSTTATRVDADTHLLTATGATADGVDVDGVAFDDATDVSLDLYVTADCRILNDTVSFDATRNGSELDGEVHVRYDDVWSTTVDAPAWFARNESTHLLPASTDGPGVRVAA